jgi:hypothetical protein
LPPATPTSTATSATTPSTQPIPRGWKVKASVGLRECGPIPTRRAGQLC